MLASCCNAALTQRRNNGRGKTTDQSNEASAYWTDKDNWGMALSKKG
jgi:hypothetical protein